MSQHSYFSHAIIALAASVSFGSCTKEISQSPVEAADQAPILQKINSNSVPSNVDLAVLYTKRVMTFDAYLNPSDDPDGSLQSLGQPFNSGIYLLGGGNYTSKSHSFRQITIPAGYTHIFAPMIFILSWYNACDPSYFPAPGQSDEDFLYGTVSPYVDKSITLECRLNKKSQIRGNYDVYRVTTPVFTSMIHPSWGLGYGTCGLDDQPFLGTSIVDGYWVLIPIPDKNFTLEIGGGINSNHHGLRGGIFRNDVTYTVSR